MAERFLRSPSLHLLQENLIKLLDVFDFPKSYVSLKFNSIKNKSIFVFCIHIDHHKFIVEFCKLSSLWFL